MNLSLVLVSCLALVCVLSLALSLVLLVLIQKNQTQSLSVILNLFDDQRVENQSLRNQLRSQDVNTLLGLQHATLPEQATSSNAQGNAPVDLSGEIEFEENLAKQGYSVGDLNGLDASGWSPPIIKRDANGDPIAYES